MIKSFKEDGTTFEERRRTGAAVGFGTSFAAGMVIFGLGGHWLDTRYNKEPLFTLIGIALGLFYGAYEIWKLILMMNRQNAEMEMSANDEKECRK
ncbi:AtpZ/AtpI family protein [Pontiella agarivorans]|uniref:AtpZ/AtpI family protein n=1 Tax=Pontiella agarivorans TaxID=3038953 RepID=A0ABU5MXD2_9BACT|nr:AtpZ/AtpI family protein [Pontiella agarivorans]MDZ8118631.1 AtpZ/AtpI family protein [Pontiella agarivorans]